MFWKLLPPFYRDEMLVNLNHHIHSAFSKCKELSAKCEGGHRKGACVLPFLLCHRQWTQGKRWRLFQSLTFTAIHLWSLWHLGMTLNGQLEIFTKWFQCCTIVHCWPGLGNKMFAHCILPAYPSGTHVGLVCPSYSTNANNTCSWQGNTYTTIFDIFVWQRACTWTQWHGVTTKSTLAPCCWLQRPTVCNFHLPLSTLGATKKH